jgi:hypothetical protein
METYWMKMSEVDDGTPFEIQRNACQNLENELSDFFGQLNEKRSPK